MKNSFVFCEHSESDVAINDAMLIEFFESYKKKFFGLSLVKIKNLSYILFMVSCFFLFIGIIFPFLGFILSVNANSDFILGNGYLPFTIGCFVFCLTYWIHYGTNIFKFNSVSLRDKSPDNIQKIYEIFAIYMNSSFHRTKLLSYEKEKILKNVALHLDEKFWFTSPVLKYFKEIESSMTEEYDKQVALQKKKELNEKKEMLVKKDFENMNLHSNDIRRDFLLKALNK